MFQWYTLYFYVSIMSLSNIGQLWEESSSSLLSWVFIDMSEILPEPSLLQAAQSSNVSHPSCARSLHLCVLLFGSLQHMLMSVCQWEAQNWTQHSDVSHQGIVLLIMLFLMQPRMVSQSSMPQRCITGSAQLAGHQDLQVSFLQSCFLHSWCQACSAAWGYSLQDVVLCIFHWTLFYSYLLISLILRSLWMAPQSSTASVPPQSHISKHLLRVFAVPSPTAPAEM